MLSPTWTPFSSRQYSYNLYNPQYSNQNACDPIADCADQFAELTLKPLKRPPSHYLCHLCFQKGHYIKDCPKVGTNYVILVRPYVIDKLNMNDTLMKFSNRILDGLKITIVNELR